MLEDMEKKKSWLCSLADLEPWIPGFTPICACTRCVATFPPPPSPAFTNVCPYFVTIGCRFEDCKQAHPAELAALSESYKGGAPAAIAKAHNFVLAPVKGAKALHMTKQKKGGASHAPPPPQTPAEVDEEFQFISGGSNEHPNVAVFWIAWSMLVAADDLLGELEKIKEPEEVVAAEAAAAAKAAAARGV